MPHRRHTEEWLLFLDESGAFERDAGVWVAGLLLQEADTPDLHRVVRSLIDRVNPTLPYPPHAAHTQLAAFHLAAWRIAPEAVRNRHFARGQMEDADASAADADLDRHEALVEAVRCLEAGRMPRIDTLRLLERALEDRAWPAWSALRHVANQTMLSMGNALAEVARQYGGGRSAIVGAYDGDAPELLLDAEHPWSGDRYLGLLEATFERVYAVLRARPPAHRRVRIKPATRDVRRPPVPRPLPLRSADVEQAIRLAERFPLDPPPAGQTDEHVRLVCDVPAPYDALVHPGIVLADFIANQLRPTLQSGTSWKHLADVVRETMGLSVALVPRAAPDAAPHPTIAAGGCARGIVKEAFASRVAEAERFGPAGRAALASVSPPWAREQAESWVAFALDLS